MTASDNLRVKIMARIVELVEFSGSARQDSLEKLKAYNQKQDIVPIILDLILGDDLGYSHRTAAAMLLAEWQEQRVLPVLEQLLGSNFFALQEAALSALYRFGDPLGIEPIIAVLDHPDHQLAGLACDYLGASSSVKVVAPLTRLLNQADDYLKQRAIQALKAHGSEEAQKALEEESY